MTVFILLLIGIGVLFSVRICISKLYEARNGSSFGSTILFTFFFSLFASIFLFCLNKFTLNFTWFSFVFAIVIAIIEILAAILAIKILHFGSPLVYTLFLLAGEISFPFIYGVIVGEKITVFRVIGAVLAIFCVAIPVIFSKEKINSKMKILFFIFCIFALILDGTTGIVLELHGNGLFGKFEPISSLDLTLTYFIVMAILSPICYLIWRFAKRKEIAEKHPFINKWLFIFAICYAVIGSVGNLLNIYCASSPEVPASLQFGLIACTQIVVSSLIGWLVFKEKVNKITISQIVIAISAAVLLMF